MQGPHPPFFILLKESADPVGTAKIRSDIAAFDGKGISVEINGADDYSLCSYNSRHVPVDGAAEERHLIDEVDNRVVHRDVKR